MKSLNIIASIFLGIGLLIIGLYFSKFHSGLAADQDTWGQFGDLFGGIFNPLISLITVFAVYKTIKMTKYQINSGHFFELIRLHNDRRNEISCKSNTDVVNGVSAFEQYLVNLKNIHFVACRVYFENRVSQFPDLLIDQEYQMIFKKYNLNNGLAYSDAFAKAIINNWRIEERRERANEAFVNATREEQLDILSLEYLLVKQNKNELSHWQAVYEDFYRVHGNETGIYFRNLYNILETVDSMFSRDSESLAKLFRAQLSRPEIALLYFNLLGNYSSNEFYKLVLKHKLLKGLYLADVTMFANYQVIEPNEYLELLKKKYDG